MPLQAPGRKNLWLTLTLLIAVVPACKGDSAPPAPVQPPAPAAPAPPPPAPPPAAPAPAPSALRSALLAIADADGFRALAADDFRLLENQEKRPAKITVKLPRDKVDAKLFNQKIKARLPREPDPAGGEGEDLRCDDAQRTCVFSDETGRATTYLFSAAPGVTAAAPGAADQPKLREIQVGAVPR
jgi:hypothetical protein